MNELDFENILKASEGLVVIDFSATWCMPCRMLKPIIERVAEKMPDVDFYDLDVDETEEIAKKYLEENYQADGLSVTDYGFEYNATLGNIKTDCVYDKNSSMMLVAEYYKAAE